MVELWTPSHKRLEFKGKQNHVLKRVERKDSFALNCGS